MTSLKPLKKTLVNTDGCAPVDTAPCEDTLKRLSKLRAKALLNDPFFGSLLMRLQLVENNQQETMATDGSHIYYNKTFTATLKDDECTGVLMHELLHCAYYHVWRRQTRDPILFNIAADLAINPILKDCGFKLPANALDDKKYHNMAAEQIYALLMKEVDKQIEKLKEQFLASGTGTFEDSKQGKGDKDGDGKDGKSAPAPSEGMTEIDWQIAVEQAANMAERAGRLPAGLRRTIDLNKKPKADWRAVLRRFIQNTIPCDYTWSTPNRRYISQGLYLPGVRKENTPRIAIGVDTSGSISTAELSAFAAELTAIMQECKPEKMVVLYCDAEVNAVEEFTPEDNCVDLKPYGGGGTRFSPIFEAIEKMEDDPPAVLIYLTDLYSSDTPKEPEYPVLWVVTEKSSAHHPFGELVVLADQ